MNFLKSRVLPLVLSVVTAFSLMNPVSAGFGAVELPDPFEPASFFDPEFFMSEMDRLYGDQSADHCAFFSEFAYIANKDNWTTTTKDNLALLATYWNMSLGPQYSSTAAVGSHTLDDGTQLYYVRVMIDDERLNGGRRNWNWCLNDGAGCILVALPEEDPDTSISASGHWEELNSATLNTSVKHLEHYKDLANAAQDLGGRLLHHGNYWFITKTIGLKDYLLFNPDNQIYATVYEEDMWATGQDRPQTEVKDEVGDIVDGVLEGLNSGIDLGSMTITLPDGTINLIDQIIYDESTKSYHIDSHDTYNYEINNYYTWNYYINYTSITYIGQTEEYNKYYEVYYELPDGRSSADLTKEDLEQLNLSVDVIPYGRSADDTSLRSLYHFDGDTKDSSYWNYCTAFTWKQGASLTYMDAGVFEGALYLDETAHDFSITLPSYIGTNDFTLQFRYYQSSTLTPVNDSYVRIGGFKCLDMTGSQLRGNTGVTLPVGQWNEVAIIRHNGTFYYYLNGVSWENFVYRDNLSNVIQFSFGSQQQTFKYLDEIRVLDYAIAKGENYEPSSVPHDTNLTLVLPDAQVPVADEYWSFNSDGNLMPVWNYTEYHDSSSVLKQVNRSMLWADFGYGGNSSYGTADKVWYSFKANDTSSYKVSAGYSDSSWLFKNVSGSFFSGLPTRQTWINEPTFLTLLGGYDESTFSYTSPYGLRANGVYTFSVLLSNGEYESVTFTLDYGSSSLYQYAEFSNGGRIGYIANEFYTRGDSSRYLFIAPPANGSLDIVYMELVEGSSPNTGHEFVESVTVFDKAELNTPTLAVRTDIDITSYQIGGVRPSLPTKGQVWAMVENDRIVSIQIYNGQAWEGVDGRIWTGERWIPASSYNIITLQDLYDIVDATPNYEYIYSEAGFWAWWQKSWNAFTEKLFATLGAGGVAGGTSINPDKLPSVPDDESTSEDDGWSFVELLVVLKDGTWNVITGVVSTAYDGFYGFVQAVSDSGSFFDYYDPDNEQSIFFIPLEEGASVWD